MKNNTSIYKDCRLAASFTLEASIILPIVIITIFYIILLIFSLHDAIAAKSISYRYLIAYSMTEQDIYKYNNGFAYNIKNEFYNASLMHNNPSFKLKQDKNNLQAVSSYYSLPVTFSNYNNTEILQAFKAQRKLFTKSEQ